MAIQGPGDTSLLATPIDNRIYFAGEYIGFGETAAEVLLGGSIPDDGGNVSFEAEVRSSTLAQQQTFSP